MSEFITRIINCITPIISSITPIINILTCLCDYCAKWKDSMDKLEEELNSLRNDSGQLNGMYLDVKMRVETAEQDPDPELVVLNKVKSWMGRVEVLQNKIHGILQQKDVQAILDQETAQQDPNQETKAGCLGSCCPKNCWACCKLQKVTQKLREVNALISEGHFAVVAQKFARDRFNELPVGKAVGIESTLQKLCSCFDNNQVRTIGLFGMGGVGKTTLLKIFNNDFLSRKVEYVVIWVVASKDVNPEKIQNAIKEKLRVSDDIWNSKTIEGRADLIYNFLKKKKFVFLLDDLWGKIDLLKLGVPSPNNGCKIILTTRWKDVCGQMDVDRLLKVQCLTQDKAFDLFKEKVGEATFNNPHILPLAKQVVQECKGLPLALCTVGRAMANKESLDEWKRAIEILRNYPSKVQGIIEDVYYLLEFSYDRLPNVTYKSCFLYCALFPEDYNIEKRDLILLWIAEGFLAEFDYDINEAHKEGEDIILNLKRACLLENGEKINTIKMHDVIRDMALWVAGNHGEKISFLVRDCSLTGVLEVYNDPKWKEAEKLSLWNRGTLVTNFPQKPHCPNLVTLLIRNTLIDVFPTEVFVLTSTIKVLDLSFNEGIINLPSAIGDFVNLEYMNLSSTNIKKLPEELKNLKKLRFLLLDYLEALEIPKEVLSSLLSLQAFSVRGPWTVIDDGYVWLLELEGLDHIQDIRITVSRISSVEKILTSSKLQRCTRELYVHDVSSSIHQNVISSLGKMGHNESLYFNGARIQEHFEAADIPRSSFWGHEHIIILRKLILSGCETIIDLNWLIHAPNLEILGLKDCGSLVEVISEDFGIADTETGESYLFSRLTFLSMRSLYKLRSICRLALQFPCLRMIEILDCPNLEKLPFNSQSALESLRSFLGYPIMWFDQLQWEDKATKDLISSKFEKSDPFQIILRRDYFPKTFPFQVKNRVPVSKKDF